MAEDIQKQLIRLNNELNKLKKLFEDHTHNGYDALKIRLKDFENTLFMQATLNPSNLVDGAGETLQVTGIKGATLGDWVIVSAPYDLQDITVTSYVQANNVVEIRLQNESGSTVNLSSGIWRILVIKKIV
jgi:hypothetical protein